MNEQQKQLFDEMQDKVWLEFSVKKLEEKRNAMLQAIHEYEHAEAVINHQLGSTVRTHHKGAIQAFVEWLKRVWNAEK